MFFVSVFLAFAKPVPVLGVIAGLGWGDSILLLLLTIEFIALITYCISDYAKYAPVFKKQKAKNQVLKKRAGK